MNFEPIILHVQEYGFVYFGVALVSIPLIVVFRKYTLPFIYHTVEYALYCSVAHFFIGGLTRAFSWFRGQTTFKSFDDSEPVASFTTPLTNGFWQKDLYTPEWLFWFEIGVAVLLLYVVVIVRPVKFKQKPYKSRKPKPGQLSSRDGRPAKQYTVNVK